MSWIFAVNSLVDSLTPYQEIFSSSDLRNLKILFYILAGLFAIFGLLYYFAGRIKPKDIQVIQATKRKDFESEIKIIHNYHTKEGLYREGCYKISAILKSFLETIYEKDVEEMTVFEIERNLNDNGAREIMRQLSNYQFRKNDTTKAEFEKIYHRSLELIQERKRFLAK